MFKVSISAFPEMLPLLPGLWLYEGIKIWWLLVASEQAKEDDRAALMLVGNITRSKKHANISTIATPCDEAPSRTPWKFYTEHRGTRGHTPRLGNEVGRMASHSLGLAALDHDSGSPPSLSSRPGQQSLAPISPFLEVKWAEQGPRLKYPKNGTTPPSEGTDCI